jgi:hypothetical protein
MSNVSVLAPERLRQRFHLESFVETGCFHGESLETAQHAGFGKLVSCDISEACVAECRGKFPRAAIWHGDSLTMLGQFLPGLPEFAGRTLFWLDAHYPSFYGIEETESLRYPLPEELNLIRRTKPGWEHDVIAFDDLRVIRDPHNPCYRPGELQGKDFGLYVDITLASLYMPFAATHSLQIIRLGEGAAALLPYA